MTPIWPSFPRSPIHPVTITCVKSCVDSHGSRICNDCQRNTFSCRPSASIYWTVVVLSNKILPPSRHNMSAILRLARRVPTATISRQPVLGTRPPQRLPLAFVAPSRVQMPAFLRSAAGKGQKRMYHDDGVYGYRVRREFKMPDYTAEELANRIENGSLLRLVIAYRTHGHRGAYLDPLDIIERENVLALDPSRYGLTDPHKVYNLSGILHVNESKTDKTSLEEATFETIHTHLKSVYSGRIAYEFIHIPDASERRWFYHAVESWEKPVMSPHEKRRIFELLSRSEVFDHFMAKKFAQVKRYGLEGAESMMTALDRLFNMASHAGVRDVVLGMPHRGRLNLLTDLLQYPLAALFHKIKGNSEFPPDVIGAGDVLSHIGISQGDVSGRSERTEFTIPISISYAANTPTLDYGAAHGLKVSLLQNPSHLEAVNPVTMGKARAKQMEMMKTEKECELGDRVMCVQLHGDAAFTGQGIVMESFGLSNLPHYSSGGSLHIVVNNQLGYTTPAQNARSSVYASDIGKMINAPVVHVNGDFPEDVARAVELCFEYRNKFRKDVILDLVTYRRWGHNELDEPAFTQPLMYRNIRARKSVPRLYEDKLLKEGILSSQAEINQLRDSYFATLESNIKNADSYIPVADHLSGPWTGMVQPRDYANGDISNPDTGVEPDTLSAVGRASVTPPTPITVHQRVDKYHVQARLTRVAEGKRIDWATAEALAFGSLLLEGFGVRISGQDVGRGTFSQRHAMLVCQESERVVVPLNHLKEVGGQGYLEVANSNLSEMAVLGFEYGMSWETPRSLNIWEAQFGDFFNSAQVIIDTYLSSGETKWLRQSGLVMLLPHGYDGGGPEHSSCRVERFLQLCDDRFDVLDNSIPVNPNMHVVNCTTPAQYFHVLRRQMKRNFRKPLVVAAPKTLLKLSAAVSNFTDMIPGTTFQPILADPIIQDASKVDRVVFVSGKLYYDLLKERQTRGVQDRVALVRVEELCPFPKNELVNEVTRFKNAQEFVWCQEEPQNNGAYTFMEPRLSQLLPSGRSLKYVGRAPSAAPATGIAVRYKTEQAAVLKNAFEA
ncbi:thiamine diphosphate-binding protein [Jimgerdemannia flammicorona]|uniref:Thiamine diphosphate-binding protein n=1 Tax=Jimgerdemannia flammicorona TaxID=994334 RepID=A0A433QL91_9FUNG|nr:thiamine diphosphate-binding protein [Jimgerdemannia flammicorona]